MFKLEYYRPQDLESLYSLRSGETKIGQTLEVIEDLDQLSSSPCTYVLIGVEEDFGVQANAGIAGAATAWPSFLTSFLNIQDNRFLSGRSIGLLGKIVPNNLDLALNFTGKVELLDSCLATILSKVFAADKIPILIGGGHNNTYPLLKALSLHHKMPINVVNLDPHADLRDLEGRHSGNAFSYALAQNYLDKYALLGLHESYNNTHIINKIEEDSFYPVFFEEIFIRNEQEWLTAIEDCHSFVSQKPFGVELDIDALENTLSSALTPVGVTAREAMQYLYQIGQQPKAAYLHLPEAVSKRADGLEQKTIGKLLSYLVTTFIKSNLPIKK